MLEVKSKGLRGRTVKQRRAHDPDSADELNASDREYVASLIRSDAATLRPVVETLYRRSTLVLGEQRITLDTDLDCDDGVRTVTGPDEVLVETKSPNGAGDLDRLLLQRGIRPHSVSKYCIGAALLYPHLQRNDWSRILRRYWPTEAAHTAHDVRHRLAA